MMHSKPDWQLITGLKVAALVAEVAPLVAPLVPPLVAALVGPLGHAEDE